MLKTASPRLWLTRIWRPFRTARAWRPS